VLLSAAGVSTGGSLHGVDASVRIASLDRSSVLGERVSDLRGRAVLIATKEQLPAALALLELDGVARRVVLCPPDLGAEHFAPVAAMAEADALVTDGSVPACASLEVPLRVGMRPVPAPVNEDRAASEETEWILLTSGTTGIPKLVLHTVASLAGKLTSTGPLEAGSVWSTFYDIRRYGGLQIFLRAVLGGASLVLSSAGEPIPHFLARAGRHAVTHISGTPTHWRRALMSGAAQAISPRYVRLSGEVADQAILDALRAAYPRATISHAFASTEAGVAFAVEDGLEGFPTTLIGQSRAGIEMKVEDGTLRIRSGRNATRYLGGELDAIRSDDGFVDTGDLVELRPDGRYHFMGRRGGVINIGGQKVFPEEVEAVINRHPRVRMSLVRGRKSPITGAIVVADVMLENASGDATIERAVKEEILDTCRRGLSPHKVPTSIRFVPSLEVSASGKLARPVA
jgi:acyl-coenzyme A synthetase/AMP-(fatty) acid ligase